MSEDLNRNDSRARGRSGSGILGILIVAGLLGGGFLLPRPGPSSVLAQPGGTLTEADSVLAARTAGCEVCQRMARDVLPGQFLHDAHDIPCADCHHPHVKRTDEQWKQICYSCHPKAWTKSVMHRLDAEVFQVCTNCHKPHVFSADATDCASCHDKGPEETVVVGSFADADGNVTFDHERHSAFDCAACHVTRDRHSNLLLKSTADCMACHHDPKQARNCSSCHGSQALAAAIPVTFENAFARSAEPRSRTLEFRHEDHAGRACADCHAQDGTNRVKVDCATCHTEHHPVTADCATCHQAAPPSSAHDFEVHWTGCDESGCHTGAGLTMPAKNRNWCASCHTDKRDHYPQGGDCVTCHLLPEGMP